MSLVVYRRRLLKDRIASVFALLTTALALLFLGSILFTLIVRGGEALKPSLFLLPTASTGSEGGLSNAIAGSLLLTALAMVFAIPVGVFAGLYLAEYGRFKKTSALVRFVNDILLSAPSICFGMFVYEIVVRPLHHFSGWAGALSLALIALPVIVRTTEDMLRLVPDQLREAAAALGAPRWHVIWFICFRAARNGILTGVLLATSRIAGETAPLLFTVLNNQFWSLDLGAPMANLPITIYQYALSPYEDWQRLAWGGALVITLGVLALNVFARFMTRGKDDVR